ncbi:hypothetical protein B1T49_03620 [Mycobacterium persicum]|nr:hypothetical protein B1T49_03620 [Mycobacterium persicum]
MLRHRLFFLAVAVALAVTACGAASHPRLWGAFTERGLANVPMKPGVNVRVFNDVNLDAHGYIKYDKSNGYLTLHPGTYRIDGWSLTSFGFKLTPEQQAAAYSAPGYAFFWNVDQKKMEILGSLQDPRYSQQSIINGVLTIRKTTNYFVGHQNGDKVDGISLQLYDPNIKMPDGQVSTNHAFAQLVVERL